MTWNVRYFGHGLRGLRSTEAQMGRIAMTIARRPDLPDVVALQEVEDRSLRGGLHDDPQHSRFARALEEACAAAGRPGRWTALYFPAHRYELPGITSIYTTGLMVLARERVDILGHNATAPHDITFRPDSFFAPLKQTRIAAHVHMSWEEGEMDLINTHLSLPSFGQVGPHRIPTSMGQGDNQLAEIGAVMDYASKLGGRETILVGDFNAARGSPVWHEVLRNGFVDAWRDDHPVPTARFAGWRMHIDHIFSTPDVHWAKRNTHSVEDGPFAGLSDHSPKVGTLLVP